jgi:hypothetical protein
MITAEEARKATKLFTFPLDLEKEIKESCLNGIRSCVYTKRLTEIEIQAMILLGYAVTRVYNGDYIISW